MQLRGREPWMPKIIWSESYKALLRTRLCGRSVSFAVHSLSCRSETLLTAYANKFRPDSPAKLMHDLSSGVPTVYIDYTKAINSDIHGSYLYGLPRSTRRSDTARPGFPSAFTSFNSAKSLHIPILAICTRSCARIPLPTVRPSAPLVFATWQTLPTRIPRIRSPLLPMDITLCPLSSATEAVDVGAGSHRLFRRWKVLRTRCFPPAVLI
ncbi:hypothetical protein C8Q73DRAFT_128046 [Cubamyces lactineus]|nr:hypothetical protein C8Q73DRAFT_128046 [Cubamyces lactineus]